jgi:hypothetical protein
MEMMGLLEWKARTKLRVKYISPLLAIAEDYFKMTSEENKPV